MDQNHLPSSIPDSDTSRRHICSSGCGRPTTVCLCHVIPTNPLPTNTHVVVLHHPHERRHKLATVPVLATCLRSCHVIIGRRLRLGQSPVLDSLYHEAVRNPNRPFRALYLFPGTDSFPASEIGEWQSSLQDCVSRDFVLVAFDGTWKHAKEMVQASLPFLSKFSTRVCLKYDAMIDGGTIFDSDLILRKEPFSGCTSTLEAVARALKILEPSGNEIEDSLLKVLQAMVKFQACYLKPTNPRPKLLKNVKAHQK